MKEKPDQDPLLLKLKVNVHKQKVMASEQGGDGVWGIKVDCEIGFKDNWDDYLSYMELLTTIVTILASKWLLMKLFMGADVDLGLDGLKLVKQGW